MKKLADLTGAAKDLGVDSWIRGCCFAVVAVDREPPYFASHPNWSSADAEDVARALGGEAVDLMGEPASESTAETCGCDGYFCSRECQEEHAGGCGEALFV